MPPIKASSTTKVVLSISTLLLEKIPGKICIGQGFKNKSGAIGIGHCTAGFEKHLEGCPPSKDEIYNFIKYLVDSST